LLLVKTVIGLDGRSVTIGNFGTYDYSQRYVPWGALALLVIGLPLVIALLTDYDRSLGTDHSST
jgi:hypothetical protein